MKKVFCNFIVVSKIDIVKCHHGVQIGVLFENGIHIFIPRWRILVLINVKNSNNKIRVKKVEEIASIANLFRVDWITHCPVKVWIQLTIYECLAFEGSGALNDMVANPDWLVLMS